MGLHLSATRPSVHSKPVGKLDLWIYLSPFLPFSTLHISECPNMKGPIYILSYGSQVWEVGGTNLLLLLSFMKTKQECFFPVLPFPSQCSAPHQPVLEEKC